MRHPKHTLLLTAVALAALAASMLPSSGPASAAEDHAPQGLVVNRAGAAPGYTLFAPLELERTYLMDMDGKIVHTWKTDTRPGLSEYLLPNGHLLRAGNLELANGFKTGAGAGGRVEELDWDGNLLWRFDYANGSHIQHHDIEPMPNGNVLVLAWERKSAEETIAAGRSPKLLPDAELWPDSVLEYSPAAGRIVWEWHVWDHLVQDHDPTKANYGDVAAHPEKIDLNYVLEGTGGDKDWNHANGIDYNAARDEIIVSARSFSEFWVIDHSTTTETARGAAGDLLFRYGNPATIRADAKRTLYVQHDAEWIPDGLPGAGNILVFSNGLPKSRPYSTVEEITPTLVDGEYTRAVDGTSVAEDHTVYPTKRADRFFAAIVSSAQRLPNGNTVMTDGPKGKVIEATSDGRIVWEYENTHFTVRKNTPKSSGSGEPIEPWWMFRSYRYAPEYAGLLLVHAQ